METRQAVTSLAALAQESRLLIFRRLVACGPDGLSAGDLAHALHIPPNTLSFHLNHLSRAGLIDSRRDGRFVHYAVAPNGIRDLLAFLTDDCCRGRPELCGLPAPARSACDDTDC